MLHEDPTIFDIGALRKALSEYSLTESGAAIRRFAELGKSKRPVRPDQAAPLDGPAAECFTRICEAQVNHCGVTS